MVHRKSPPRCPPACRNGRIKLLYLSELLNDPGQEKGQSCLSERQNMTRPDHNAAADTNAANATNAAV